MNEAHLTYIMPHYYTQYHVHISVNLFLSLVRWTLVRHLILWVSVDGFKWEYVCHHDE